MMGIVMFDKLKTFLQKEDGAITVDWVVLTAAVVALGGVAITSIQGASGSVGTVVENGLTGVNVTTGLYED